MAYVLHQLLTESAARRPDAEAVRLLHQALSYAELEKLSNQLAHALIEIGVVPGDRIGIYLTQIALRNRRPVWSYENRSVLCSGRSKCSRPTPGGNREAMRLPRADHEFFAL